MRKSAGQDSRQSVYGSMEIVVGRKEIDIVIWSCKNCLALGVCTYYHTITTRQLMIYDATTERSARKIMRLIGVLKEKKQKQNNSLTEI